MANCLDKLIDKCDSELETLSKKPDLDDNNLTRLKRWAQTLSNLETVKAMRETYPDGYPPRSYGAAPSRDARGDTYGRYVGAPRIPYYGGDMPARADWPRDSYGAHGDALARLRDSLSAAKTDRERDAIRRAIRDIETP